MKCRILVFIFALFIIPCRPIFSQALQNDVIASAGDTYIVANAEISWTLGESAIESYRSGKTFVSQGFHQPMIKFLEISEQEKPVFQVSIFPNPTSRFVRVEITGSPETDDFSLILSDMMGKVLLGRSVKPQSCDQLDLEEYSSGVLLLKIIRESDGMQRAFKIIRTND